MSSDKELLKLLPSNAILTPHPKEFDRLAGSSGNGYDRHIKQREFSKKYNVIVILKGAYTGISFPDTSYFFNMNGNPGMATGGSGDVLSGIIVSLLARGLTPSDASVSGVFLHGLAGDLAVEIMDLEAMIAGDIIEHLGEAFKQLKEKPFLHEGRTGGVIQ
jgi:ADP-dependent NAD(P)H-hydrate dehydratase / NAD(P)H-hydrate epimerase